MSDIFYDMGAGGKPSTWFPPGRLVEQDLGLQARLPEFQIFIKAVAIWNEREWNPTKTDLIPILASIPIPIPIRNPGPNLNPDPDRDPYPNPDPIVHPPDGDPNHNSNNEAWPRSQPQTWSWSRSGIQLWKKNNKQKMLQNDIHENKLHATGTK